MPAAAVAERQRLGEEGLQPALARAGEQAQRLAERDAEPDRGDQQRLRAAPLQRCEDQRVQDRAQRRPGQRRREARPASAMPADPAPRPPAATRMPLSAAKAPTVAKSPKARLIRPVMP